jgi:hypothetical protein
MKNLEHKSGSIVYTPDVNRAAYNRFLAFLSMISPGVEFIITPFFIRLEQALSATKSKYTFSFYENQGSDRQQEIKLNRNDLFMMTHASLCLAKQDTTAGDYGNYLPHSFPDPNYFAGLSGGVNEFECLNTVYNGKLNFLTKPVQRIENFSTVPFLKIPQTQTVLQAGSQLNDEPAEFRLNDVLVDLQPNLILSGQENHQVELELGAGTTTLIAGGVNNSGTAVDTSNIAIFFGVGYKAVNAATAASRWAVGAY